MLPVKGEQTYIPQMQSVKTAKTDPTECGHILMWNEGGKFPVMFLAVS